MDRQIPHQNNQIFHRGPLATDAEFAIQETYQSLAEAAKRLPDSSVAEALAYDSEYLDDLFENVGSGPVAIEKIQTGDVILSRPMFAEDDPRIEVVSAPDGWLQEQTNSNSSSGISVFRPVSLAEQDEGAWDSPESLEENAAMRLIDAQEVHPALLVAGAAGKVLGPSIAGPLFKRLDKYVFEDSGYTFRSQAARHISNSAPPGLPVRTIEKEMVIETLDGSVYFRVTLVVDGFSIFHASIKINRSKSYRVWPGDFKMKIHPVNVGNPADPIKVIQFSIDNGRWDPVVGGDHGFSGYVRVTGEGRVNISQRAGGHHVLFRRPARHRSGPRIVRPKLAPTVPQVAVPPSPTAGHTPAPAPRARSRSRRSRSRTVKLPGPIRGRTGLEVYFALGSSRLGQSVQEAISRWFEKMPGQAKAAIQGGSWQLQLVGYASSDGNYKSNQRLSLRRSESLRRFLQNYLGPGLNIAVAPRGEIFPPGSTVSPPMQRKVEIRIPRLVR